MSKKHPKKSEQAGLHEKRLADLLKFLSDSETSIKADGITYTSKRGDGYNHIKDVIQQVTGMSEKAYYTYFEDMELGNKFSEMRKVYDTVGKVIHSIRPYLTFDGPIDSQNNSLLISNTYYSEPFKVTNEVQYVEEFYEPFYNTVLSFIENFETEPAKTLGYIKEHETPLYFHLKQLLVELKDNELTGICKEVSAKYKSDYNSLLNSENSPGFISGYRSLSIPTNPETAKTFFYRSVASETTNETEPLYHPEKHLNVLEYRYEYIWTLHLQKIEFNQWPEIAKAILPIFIFEQSILTNFIELLIYHCIDNTLFQVTSASDEIRPKHVHTDFTYDQLCELLSEYQFFNIEKDFLPNELNLLGRSLNIHPVYDVAKLGESESILRTIILKQIWTIYYKKVLRDLDINQQEYSNPIPRVRTNGIISLIND